VFFHGGYWRALSARDYSFAAVGPARRGVLTVCVNYSLAPRVTIDEIVRQARSAIAWVATNVAQYGGDPSKIVVGGHSAGAQLAAMCVLTDWPNDYGLAADVIKGALLVSGIFDLAPLRYSYVQPQIQLDEGLIRRNSPLEHVRKTDVPAMLAVGERESPEFHRQSATFHEAWLAADNRSVVEVVRDADHFGALEPMLDANSSLATWITQCSGTGLPERQ
jgi:arylformamidase